MCSEEEAAAELHWFAKWEEDLPSPEELMPLSQSLIPPGLATAFDIPTTATTANNNQDSPSNGNPSSATKKPRLVWTPQLHKRFVDAISQLGIKNAVPKTIMQLMNVEGLTRENVASHLQKYRLYIKRVEMQLSASPPSSSASAFIVNAATERLFATAPVPRQFLRGPFVPVAAVQQHYRPIAAAAAQQNQYYQQRHVGLMMRDHPKMMAMKQPMQNPYVQYLASGREDGRRALNLFPTGLD